MGMREITRAKDEDGDDITLPGVYGVCHAVLGIWAPSHPVVDKIDRVISTVSIIKNWWQGNHSDRSIKEAVQYMEKRGFKFQTRTISKFGTGTYSGILDSLVHDVTTETEPVEKVFGVYRVKIYQSPWGQKLAYLTTKDSEYNYPMGPVQPMFIQGDPEKYMEKVRDLMWKRLETSGASELLLRFVKNQEKRDFPTLEAVGIEGDYVSEGAEKDWMDLGKLASRCQHFQSKGYSRKILFYGPPGTGKTTLARKLAGHVDGGRVLRIDFDAFSEAPSGVQNLIRFLKPTVLLFDDFDRMYERDCSTLSEMESLEGLSTNMVVIGTANYLGKLDLALLRPGRFDEVLLVPEPGDKHREAIIRHYLVKNNVTGLEAADLCEKTQGFSPVDIRELVRCASAVGTEHIMDEIVRLQEQRKLYTGASTDPQKLLALLGTAGYGHEHAGYTDCSPDKDATPGIDYAKCEDSQCEGDMPKAHTEHLGRVLR